MRGRFPLPAAFLLAAVAWPAWAGDGAVTAPLVTDPLRLASLPLDLEDAAEPPAGEWQLTTRLAYFNLWYQSWHPARFHLDRGRAGTPLRPDELRAMERDFPDDDIAQLDVEGWRGEVRLRRGLGGGWAATLAVGWLEIGRPHWDGISAAVHERIGLAVGDRDVFPRGQTTFYLWSPQRHTAVERWDDLEGTALVDAHVAVTGTLGEILGASQRVVLAGELPTGRRGTLAGTGGTDVGVRWFSVWRGERWAATVGAGYTWLVGGDLLGVKRSDTWHALLYGRRRSAGGAGEVWLEARLDASPLRRFSTGPVGDPAAVVSLGVRRRLVSGRWLVASITENVPGVGVAPDYAMGLGLEAEVPEH